MESLDLPINTSNQRTTCRPAPLARQVPTPIRSPSRFSSCAQRARLPKRKASCRRAHSFSSPAARERMRSWADSSRAGPTSTNGTAGPSRDIGTLRLPVALQSQRSGSRQRMGHTGRADTRASILLLGLIASVPGGRRRGESDRPRLSQRTEEFQHGLQLWRSPRGWTLGDRKDQEIALRVQHFSNAGIKHPNPGEYFVQLRYSWHLN